MSSDWLSHIKHSPSFKAALEEYHQRFATHNGDTTSLPKTCMRDVLDTISSVEESIKAKSKSRAASGVHTRLKSLLDFINRYSLAIDCLVQGVSGDPISPASLVWGLLRIVLEAASSAVRYTESILNLLEDLGSKVSLYSVYEEILSDQPRFKNALAEVYLDLIVVLVKARQKLCKNRGISKFLRFWTINFESDFGEELKAVQRHVEALKNETTLGHRIHMHNFVAESRLTETPGVTEQSELEVKINRWLSPLDCWSRMADIDAIRHPGSGMWLLENKKYLQWKDPASESSLLWLWGDPGMGKTVLSSIIVRDVGETTNFAVAYFHCDGDNEPSRTTLGLYASIITQLKATYQTRRSNSSLPQCVVDAYERSVKFGRPSLSSADSPDELILELALLFAEPIVLVIDGLDEMADPDKTLDSLLKLSKRSKSLRILFLSRHIPAIRKVLHHLPQVRLSPADLEHDIRSYVSTRIQDIPLDDHSMRSQVVNQVCSKAKGMFLWAKMVMDDLVLATSPTHLSTILDQCPPGLYAIYEHFLYGLVAQSPERQNLTRDIIQWVICAARPLTVEELEGALITKPNGQSEKPFRSVIIDACSPFITVAVTGNTVRAVHESVREYLTMQATNHIQLESRISTFLIAPKEAHAELALRCVNHVHNGVFPRTDFQNLSTVTGHPFDSYALASWCHHTISGHYRADLECQIGHLLRTTEKRQAWLYHMIFVGVGEAFPFQMILRLQTRLSDWSKSRNKAVDADATEGLRATDEDWSMDALELLLRLQGPGNEIDSDINTTRQGTHTNIDISYFEKMMVMRDLARRLTQGGFLASAISRLKALMKSPESESHAAPSTSFVLNILGMLYDQQGQRDLSRDAHLEALALQTAAAGALDIARSKDPESIWSVNELGRVYRHLNDFDEAMRMHRSALTVLTNTLATDHPERLWTMATMARALRAQNIPGEALELSLEVYNARCQSPGELHPHTLWSAGDVAKCYRDMGYHKEAMSWFQRALKGRKSTLGLDHPDTFWSMNHVGLVLEDLGRHEEAIDMHEMALKGQVKALGEDHDHTTWTRNVIRRLS